MNMKPKSINGLTSLMILFLSPFSASFALGVVWTDPNGGSITLSPTAANAYTFVANVNSADTENHTYTVTSRLTWNGGAATAILSYTTADNFDVNATYTGFQADTVYTLGITVTESVTGTVATDTVTITTSSIWVDVDFNSNPGTTLVLTNGQFSDYLWGDERGTGWPSGVGSSDTWTQFGANSGSDPVQNFYDDYDPVVTNAGSNTVDLTYVIDGNYVTGTYTFTTADEVQSTTTIPVISPPFLAPKFLHEFGPYPNTATVSGTLSGQVTRSWSETHSTTNSTTASVSTGQTVTGTISGSVGVKSVEASNSVTLSTTVTSQVATTASMTRAGSKTEGQSVTVTQQLQAGQRLRWYSHIATTQANFTVTYYKDIAPRDGIPDVAAVQTATGLVTNPIGMGNHATLVPSPPSP